MSEDGVTPDDLPFWGDYGPEITALIIVVLAFVFAGVADRFLARRGKRLAQAITRTEHLDPSVETRLRILRRVVETAIVIVGLGLALSQFTGISRLATSILASSAIAAAVLGLAARQTLGNAIAGLILAITQPIRVGDYVTFEDEYGTVEDIRLNFTVLRTPADQRIIIPNEKLVTTKLRNETLETEAVGFDIALWLAPDADVGRAVTLLEDETGQSVTVAAAFAHGIKLSVGGDPVAPGERYGAEAVLRLRCLRRLHEESLLPPPGAPIMEP